MRSKPFSSSFYGGLSLVALSLLLFVSSCDTPEKVLKSDDRNYKKMKAISWYNKKEYVKAIPVLEDLIGTLKGIEPTEEFYFMYADANYKQGDYMISAYHFKNFYTLYPNSDKAEQALYMQAKSFEMLSPKVDLDQTYTYKALEAYQFYLSSFPSGSYIYDSNLSIAKMRRKLEKKALNAAELYFKTSNFRAAATCYALILKDFPDIEESEKISFMIVKSAYKYAQNSIPGKKAERFNIVIKNYADFKYKFGASKYLGEAKKYEMQSHYQAAISAFEWAEIAPMEEREKLFNTFLKEATMQLPFLTDEKEVSEVNWLIERSYFLIVKSNYQLSDEKKNKEKLKPLEQTIKTYYTFVDKFPKSRYSKEAEKIFEHSTTQLNKLKNG